MKSKIKIFIVSAAFLAALPLATLAQTSESIPSFQADIKVNSNAGIRVTEKILYDFGSNQRHGIYRDVPIKYKARGGNFNLRISDISVTDETGAPYRYQAKIAGSNEEIKIGDPNFMVTGQKTYVISYTIDRAINYFYDHDELYWNVTGNEWQVPIANASASVALPEAADAKDIQIRCFAGSFGSTDPCGAILTGQGKIAAVNFSHTNLGPGQGLTVVVGFPVGLVTKPSAAQNAASTVADNWVLAVPILTFLLLFYLWHTRGRDPKGYETVVAQYEPPQGLTPTEAGTIVDENADNQDISAEIIYLATKGYLKITRTEKKILIFDTIDYQLDMLKEPAGLENKFDIRLMESLFQGKKTIMLSDLKRNFYEDLKGIKGDVYDSVVAKGYFLRNPQTVRNTYRVLGALVAGLGLVLGIITGQFFYFLGFGLSAVLIVIFSFFMPEKTARGAQAKQYILGLKRYIGVAEKDRLAFHNAPEKSPERFEKLLPYAMALGVDAAWAKQFEGIYNQPPSWYNDPAHGAFNAVFFASSLRNFSASANTAMAAKPAPSGGAAGGISGFGGGGFSGGGFGGGGGGSW